MASASLALLALSALAAPSPQVLAKDDGCIVAYLIDADGDLALDGWSVRLQGSGGATLASHPVDPDSGAYVFDGLEPGRYSLQAYRQWTVRQAHHTSWSLPREVLVEDRSRVNVRLALLGDADSHAHYSSEGARTRNVPCVVPVLEDESLAAPLDLRLYALGPGGHAHPLVGDGRGSFYVEPWRGLELPFAVRLEDARFEPAEYVVSEKQALRVVLRGTGSLRVVPGDVAGTTIDEVAVFRQPDPFFDGGAARSGASRPTRIVVADTDPIVLQHLVPGRYNVEVRATGRPPTVVEDVVVPAGDEGSLEVTLADWLTLRGRALPTRGQAVPIRVELTPGRAPGRLDTPQTLSVPASLGGSKTSSWVQIEQVAAEATVSPSAPFELPLLAPGPYVARVASSPWCVAYYTLDLTTASAPVAWSAPPTETLSVRVLLPDGCEPTDLALMPRYRVIADRILAELRQRHGEAFVVGAKELLRRAVNDSRSTPLDTEGRATISGLPAENLVLDIVEVGSESALFAVPISNTGGIQVLDLREAFPRDISVEVQIKGGAPPNFGEVQLYAIDEAGNVGAAPTSSAWLQRGRTTLRQVLPGDYLAAFPGGSGVALERVTTTTNGGALTLQTEVAQGRVVVHLLGDTTASARVLVLERIEGSSRIRGVVPFVAQSGTERNITLPAGRYRLTDPEHDQHVEFDWPAAEPKLLQLDLRGK